MEYSTTQYIEDLEAQIKQAHNEYAELAADYAKVVAKLVDVEYELSKPFEVDGVTTYMYHLCSAIIEYGGTDILLLRELALAAIAPLEVSLRDE